MKKSIKLSHRIDKNAEDIARRINSVLDLRAAGLKNIEIANKLGISKRRVENDLAVLRESSVKERFLDTLTRRINLTRKTPPHLAEHVVKKMNRVYLLRLQGHTTDQISDMMKIDKDTVLRYLKWLSESVSSETARTLKKPPIKMQSIDVARRRNRVFGLRLKGATEQEIVDSLKKEGIEISEGSIVNDIQFLRKSVGEETARAMQYPPTKKVVEYAHEINQVLDLTLLGNSTPEICRVTGLTKSQVEDRLRILRNSVSVETKERVWGKKTRIGTFTPNLLEKAYRRNAVFNLRMEGNTGKDIAGELGITRYEVITDLKFLKNSVSPETAKKLAKAGERRSLVSKRTRTTAQRRNLVFDLRLQGRTIASIAEEIGVAVRTVRSDLSFLMSSVEEKTAKQLQSPLKRKFRLTPASMKKIKRLNKVIDMRLQGLAGTQIAKKLKPKITYSLVYQDLKELRQSVGKITSLRLKYGIPVIEGEDIYSETRKHYKNWPKGKISTQINRFEKALTEFDAYATHRKVGGRPYLQTHEGKIQQLQRNELVLQRNALISLVKGTGIDEAGAGVLARRLEQLDKK